MGSSRNCVKVTGCSSNRIPIYTLQSLARRRESQVPPSLFPPGYTFLQPIPLEQFTQTIVAIDAASIRFTASSLVEQPIVLGFSGVGPAIETKILFGNEEENIGGGYDPITSTFQAPIDGIYSFAFVLSIMLPQGTDAGFFVVIENLNNENAVTIQGDNLLEDPQANNEIIISGAASLFLRAGQRVEFNINGLALQGITTAIITSALIAGGIISTVPL